ncbi:hypothetical protein EYF80_050115 [Liparis tanakae]|uniref:Uncharacterized protein n=1 Tax=Liparis tanakae TaxID=230148 RepID=A0A4Z2FEW3_9TELE|nr:hypothetical protein EYF80_050115 [Liparis tanakae]
MPRCSSTGRPPSSQGDSLDSVGLLPSPSPLGSSARSSSGQSVVFSRESLIVYVRNWRDGPAPAERPLVRNDL